MSQVIDTKVVEMQFDNSKFEKNIEVSLNSLKFLNKSIDAMGKNRNSFDALTHASDKLALSFDNMQEKKRISINLFDMLAGVGTQAFNKITAAVSNFALNMANSLSGIQAMRDGFAEYELKMGSVQTILMGARIFDENGKAITDEARRLEVVNQKLQDLNAYSDKTIYSFKDMTSNIGKFTNAGVSLDDSVAAIQGVANVAAISGANANEASRAMYNFSQALSSGSVKLIDWKSIENSNMATMDFKQQLLNTAVALGTVKKEGDKYVSTTTDLQGKVSDAFDASQGFNDSLSHQWMTTEVLTQTLKNYSTDVREMTDEELNDYKNALLKIGYTSEEVAEIIETSKKAFEAATEVKTFTQMIDTLKESLGSGWAQTFEIILGDFNEAKELWTSLNNTIDGLLSPIGKARNAILQVWKDNGGRDAMIQAFKNLFNVVKNLLSPLKALWEAFTPNTNTTGKALAIVFKGFEKLTAVVAQAAKVIGKVISLIFAPFVLLGNVISKTLNFIFGLISSVATKIINFFKPVKEAIKKFTETLSEAFNDHIIARINAFRKSITGVFSGIKQRVKDSSVVKSLTKAFKELRVVIQDLFERIIFHSSGYAKRFIDYLVRIWDAVTPLISSAVAKAIAKLSDVVLPKLRTAIKWVVDKIQNLKEVIGKINFTNTKFYKGLVSLPDKIKALGSGKGFKSLKASIRDFGSGVLDSLINKIDAFKKKLESIHMPKGLINVFDKIEAFIKKIFGAESVGEASGAADVIEKIAGEEASKKLTTFQKFLNGVSDAFQWFVKIAVEARNAMKGFMDFVVTNTPKAFKAMYNFIAGDDGLLTISDLTDVLYDVSYAFSTLLSAMGIQAFGVGIKNIGDAFGELTNATNTFLKQAANAERMKAIKDFALAIAILAGACYILAKIPTDKLLGAVSALGIVGLGLVKFFELITETNYTAAKVLGNLSLAVLLTSIGIAMLGVGASIMMLVKALQMFPAVIKSYNNLGEEFRTGMDRVKEVLAEIFDYLEHSGVSKYSLRSAIALFVLVHTLKSMRKVILDFAKDKDNTELTMGLLRLQQVLDMLGKFLRNVTLFNFTGINIGANFNTVGLAAMIWALGDLLKKIVPVIQKAGQIPISEVQNGMNVIKKILLYFGLFMGGLGAVAKLSGTKLGQWIGMSLTITMLTYAISSAVKSIETLTNLASGDKASGFSEAIKVLKGIFLGLAVLLAIIGKFPPTGGGTLFMLSASIGLLTLCVVTLSPIAKENPSALKGAVIGLGAVMLALGGTFLLTSKASHEAKISDIIKLIAITLSMVLLTQAIRRLAKSGASAGGIAAAGAAISGAALAIGRAMKLMNGVHIAPSVLAGLLLLTAAIWGIVFAIGAFKSSAGGMVDGAKQVEQGGDEMKDAVGVQMSDMKCMIKDAVPEMFQDIFGDIGAKIKEYFGNFDLATAFRSMIEKLTADAVNWAQDFIDLGTNLIDGISVAISNPDNVEKIKASIKALGKALLESFKLFFGINSPSTVMAEQGGYILDGLVQGLMEFPSKLADWVKGIGSFILEGVGGFFTNTIEKGKEWAGKIGEGFQNGKRFVTEKASALGKAAMEKVGKAKEWGAKALSSANAFGEKLKSSKNPIKKAAGSMLTGAISRLTGMKKTFQEASSAATSKFTSEIKSGTKPATAAAKAIVAGAKSAFKNITSSFRTFGQNAAEGFKNGINSLIKSVAEKAAEMVRKAKNAAKKEQHSESPSKDFKEFGGWAAEGYALGLVSRKSSRFIAANAQKMIDTAKNVASSTAFGLNPLALDSNPALSSLAYAMGQISDGLDENLDSSPTIRPVIDMRDISRGASLIDAIFGDRNMGATITAAGRAKDDFDRTMANRVNAMSSTSIDKLSKKIDSMTASMNSRSLNVYNNIDGASDPGAFADEVVRSFRLNARTV